ncbi:hypothetical protein BV898_16420 [Hypsibius exemplaris]|uniref:Receptor ligand binding region domain-containing protein n=1 Tax=Hypsibius exemplaris TaxID=2072580 RepID=A0A9X6NFW1_HYPEX|nr:hypothetical protein BV898_16420 [Hypsibius exemplaris]
MVVLEVEIACPGYFALNSHPSLAFNGPVIDLAVAELNAALAGRIFFTVTYLVLNVPNCLRNEEESSPALAQWYYRDRNKSSLPIVLALGCIDTLAAEQLTSEWEILNIASIGVRETGQKLPGPVPIGVGSIARPSLYAAFFSLLAMFQWTTIYIVIDTDSPPTYPTMAASIIARNRELGQLVTIVESIAWERRPTTLNDTLQRFRSVSRVLLFCGQADRLRRLLVYIAFEPFPSKSYGKMTWNYGDAENEIAQHAFDSLLVIQQHQSATSPSGSQHPPRSLDILFQREARSKYNITYDLDDQPMPDMMATYITLSMLAEVLNESLDSVSPSNFKADQIRQVELARRFFNRTFVTETGPVYIDSRGKRRDSVAVCYFGRDSGMREAFLLLPVGTNERYLRYLNNTMRWPGGNWPPINEPLCGYRHERPSCSLSTRGIPLPEIVTLLAAVLASSGAILYYYWRTKRKREEDADAWWLVELTSFRLIYRILDCALVDPDSSCEFEELPYE